MPCYRCGTRQVDPERGSSPWRRGVMADSQVLICPDCQSTADWTSELDRCLTCGSIHLVRRLGEVECRDCGSVAESAAAAIGARGADPARAGPPGPPGPPDPGIGLGGGTESPGLAEEVELALARVLRRSPRPAGIG
jgi:hypothetical protein